MKSFNIELKGEADQLQMLVANIAALKQEIYQLKAELDKYKIIKDPTDQKASLNKAKSGTYAKSSLKEEEMSDTSKEEYHQIRPRRNAISCNGGGRVFYLKLKELERLKQEINQLKAKWDSLSMTSLKEEAKEEDYQMRPRRNAISLREGGRVAYLRQVKGLKQ